MAEPSAAAPAIVRMVDIVKDFPGVRALNKVNFHANKGEVLALVGENGAGKSTLMNILSGVWPYPSYEGDLFIREQRVRFAGTRDAEAAGIAIIHQELNLIPELSVAENIFLNRLPATRGVVDWERLWRDGATMLSNFGMAIDPRAPIHQLTVGKQQMVEIAKALSIKAEILILDEPTSALSDREVADLFVIIKRLKAQGVSMIYISHKMDELRQVADSVSVLRDGVSVGEVVPIDSISDQALVAKMVGRDIGEIYPKRSAKPRDADEKPALKVDAFSVDAGDRQVDAVSFEAYRGEVLGIAGLMGSGRTELVSAIFGAYADDQRHGVVSVDGAPRAIHHPKDAIAAGIALLTEDRKLLGLVGGMSVADNATLTVLDSLVRKLMMIDRDEQTNAAAKMAAALHIKTPTLDSAVFNLSGGNQQKVVLAKWLLTKPKVLILDEPTRGVDIGAKVEIYQLIAELAEQGVAIIMISSELPEILGMSDRVMVMSEGKKVAELPRSEATPERVMHFALGRSA